MLSLTAIAELVRARRATPREMVDEHLARIAAWNPGLNAFTRVLADEARRAAERPAAGPLAGVPVTVKDSFDAADLPTLCGSRLRLGHKAQRDAAVVARLRSAGAILLGKTNTPEFLMNWETDNHVTGRTNNPWDFERTPGGSSGGEAAAIASGCSAGGVGSDGGGSIRWPAHACGICGLKPTPGRVSAAGHEPAIVHPGGLLGVAGPMARTAEDLRLLFHVLAGWDPADPFSVPMPLRRLGTAALRIGVVAFPGIDSGPVEACARLLDQLRLRSEPFDPPPLDAADEIWRFFFLRLNWIPIAAMLTGREEEAHWSGLEWFEGVRELPPPTAEDMLRQLAARDRMRAHVLTRMERIPVLLTPVAGTAAFPHRTRVFPAGGLLETMRPLHLFNLLGLPAVTIPFTQEENGLPLGVQLVGRPFEEEALLELAVRLEEARGPFPLPGLPRANSI